MKALTLWQPWASLIAAGIKTWETRPWRTEYRGTLVIHASQRQVGPIDLPDRNILALFAAALELDRLEDLRHLPRGACVAVAQLTDVVPTHRLEHGHTLPAIERHAGNFGPNRYAWKLEHILRLEQPIRAKGAQRLWNPPAQLQQAIRAGLQRGA